MTNREPCPGCLPAKPIDASYLEDCNDEKHPLFVLGSWEEIARDLLDQPSDLRITVDRSIDYLGRQLTILAASLDFGFEEFATELRGCLAHLEAVLHDGEQRDLGAPCLDCQKPLERVWSADGQPDRWWCPRCRHSVPEDQYRYAVAHFHRTDSEWQTDATLAEEFGIPRSTVRKWAERSKVGRLKMGDRTFYNRNDVRKLAKGEAA